jgi:hypothetical protein
MRIGLLATAGLSLIALAFGGCGDSNDPTTGAGLPTESTTASPGEGATGGVGSAGGAATSGAEDGQQIRASIEGLVVDPDNQLVCAEVIGRRLLEAAYGDLQGCLKGRRPATLADSVKVSGLRIDGDKATAEAVPSGGLYDGETLEIEAVREGGRWRIDQLVADIPVGP